MPFPSLFSTFLSILGGYALSRFKKRVKGLKFYTIFLLALQMFPVVQLIIPLYLTFQKIGITNTRLSVFIAYSTFTLPVFNHFCMEKMDNLAGMEQAG